MDNVILECRIEEKIKNLKQKAKDINHINRTNPYNTLIPMVEIATTIEALEYVLLLMKSES